MSESELKLRHGIKTPEQAEARFKRLRRIIGARGRSGQSFEDFLAEMSELDKFLESTGRKRFNRFLTTCQENVV